MSNIYTREALEKLGIYELRNVARQIGVYSPTLYKKGELINKVLSIISGEEERYVKVTKQGRPPKHISGLNDILNIFVPAVSSEQEMAYADRVKYQTPFIEGFMQELSGLPENVHSFSGYFIKKQENYGVVFKNGYFENNQNTYYLTPQLINNNKLKDGDFICGDYFFISEDKPLIVRNIKTINNLHLPVTAERKDLSDSVAVYPNKKIKLEINNHSLVDFKVIDRVSPIGHGSRVIINFERYPADSDFLIELLNAVSLASDIKTTLISVDERPEDLGEISNECHAINIISNNSKISSEQFLEKLNIVFENIVRHVENGENQVVVVQNLKKLTRFFTNQLIIKNKCSEIEAQALCLNRFKVAFNLAKNTLDGGALTIICLNVTSNEIIEFANTIICVKEFSYEETDIFVDVEKSHTRKAELLFKSDENKRYEDFRQDIKTKGAVEALKILFKN